MIFDCKVKETKGRLKVKFKKRPESWKRFASKLIRDKVILDIKNARKFLKSKGDKEIYRVFHFEANGLSCDFTLLRHGIFSVSKTGEPFETYGHVHERYMGEAYTVLKNSCFFELADKKTYETFILYLKKGDSIFIHPRFLHRVISFRKDCFVVNFVPKRAGHDYKVIKNKGFPIHLVYHLKEGAVGFVKNEKYRKARFMFVKRVRTKDPIKLFEKDPEKLKDILEKPRRYKKLYFKGK